MLSQQKCNIRVVKLQKTDKKAAETQTNFDQTLD